MAADAFQNAPCYLSSCEHYAVILRLHHQPVHEGRLRVANHNSWIGPCMQMLQLFPLSSSTTTLTASHNGIAGSQALVTKMLHIAEQWLGWVATVSA